MRKKNLRRQRNALRRIGVVIVTCRPKGCGKLIIQIRENGNLQTREVIKSSQARKKASSLWRVLNPQDKRPTPVKPLEIESPRKIKGAEEIAPRGISYWDLSQALNFDQECPHCKYWPNREGIWVDTIDNGTKKIYKCGKCQALLLPYQSCC